MISLTPDCRRSGAELLEEGGAGDDNDNDDTEDDDDEVLVMRHQRRDLVTVQGEYMETSARVATPGPGVITAVDTDGRIVLIGEKIHFMKW